MHKFFSALFLLIPFAATAQASFAAIGSPYTQNFNSLPNTTDGSTLATWTQNGTLPGWYIDEGNAGATCSGTACDDRPIIEATYTTINNGGNAYVFAAGSDRSIGSRAAGSSGTVYFGVRIANNTGATISSLYIDYYGEQWSIAENQANVNSFVLEYQTGATVTSLTAGTWTATGLNFSQIYSSAQSAGMGGSACAGTSAQCLALDGNAAANRTLVQGCINVTIPAGEEIMLRWADVNDGANDHHMQIDDVSIYPYDVACAIVLPVELVSFSAKRDGNSAILEWETASEQNNDYFAVERLDANGEFAAIGTVNGNGTTSQPSYYQFTDVHPLPGTNYYRLRQVDYNGNYSYSAIVAVAFEEEFPFTAQAWYHEGIQFAQSGNTGETIITILAEDGRTISSQSASAARGEIMTDAENGIYFVRFENKGNVQVVKLVILH